MLLICIWQTPEEIFIFFVRRRGHVLLHFIFEARKWIQSWWCLDNYPLYPNMNTKPVLCLILFSTSLSLFCNLTINKKLLWRLKLHFTSHQPFGLKLVTCAAQKPKLNLNLWFLVANSTDESHGIQVIQVILAHFSQWELNLELPMSSGYSWCKISIRANSDGCILSK